MADKPQMPQTQSVPLGGEVPVLVPDGLTPDAVTQILQARARALAQPPPDERSQAEAQLQVLTFALGGQVYAVEARCVEGIYFAEGLVPVPCTPDFVVGVMNVRGRILSVIDVHRFMGLEGLAAGDGVQVVAVRAAGLEVGLLTRRVIELRSLTLEELEPALPTAVATAADYTQGVTPDMLVLLELQALLGDERIIVREKVG